MLRVFLKKMSQICYLVCWSEGTIVVFVDFVCRRDKTYKRTYEAESKIAKDARPRWSQNYRLGTDCSQIIIKILIVLRKNLFSVN